VFFKRIIYILLILLVIALLFQLARTFIFTRFIGNANETNILEEPVSAIIPEDIDLDEYLVLYDEDELNSTLTLSQIEKVLDYMKIQYQSRDISGVPGININEYDSIIFSFESLDLLGKDLSSYAEYVKQGGTIIFAIRPVIDPAFLEISELLAIDSYDGLDDAANGIRIEEPILLGIEEMDEDHNFIQNSSINAALDQGKEFELYLSTHNGTPLLWETGYGDGRFIIFNGTMLNEKSNRGILSNIITLSRDTFIYPVANIKMVHIDDFPAPIPLGANEAIMDEFNRNIPQFYREVWWSDMIKLAKRYNLTYSGFIIENYGNDTEPPFESPGRIDEENFLVYGKELLNLGGELGIHGYNHQSLAPEGFIKQDLGYNSWANQEDMEESLLKLQDSINSVFRNYTIRSYVPPSNILSDMGRSAVVSSIEDLKVIAGVYLPNYEGDVYEQEFEIAPDGIVEFPRISSGYHYTPEVMWAIYNALNTHGIFAHFIHPDDILDPNRSNNLSWSELTEDYEAILDEVNRNFSWLNSYTMSRGTDEIIKYLEVKPHIDYAGDSINIYCEDFRPDAYFIMRTDKEIIDSENIEYEKFWEDAYILTLKEAQGKIVLEEK
jgi:hypothetical protein